MREIKPRLERIFSVDYYLALETSSEDLPKIITTKLLVLWRAIFVSPMCFTWSQTCFISYLHLQQQEGNSPKSVLLVASTRSVDLYDF